ncbi:MAG: 23S rRNA (adenine(2503)-C(2))-methyltransferase RlmN [Acidobacteria bacterium]|nr:MAG: 23S rRNA (adenine(2503)-C(2))-methyltransferase RlmN [Acidobacteriota bacterium]
MSRRIENSRHAGSQTFNPELQPAAAKGDLLGRSCDDLRALMAEIGERAYRGSQLYHALYAERRLAFASMSNLPAALRQRLANDFRIGMPNVSQRFRSSDASVRYLLTLADANGAQRTGEAPARVEAVFMPSDGRQTICISTQAGCAVDCHFCLTAQLGLVRNLASGEILAQVLIALEDQRQSLAPRTNVVLMGQGEPLLNYEPVMAALCIMLDPNGMALAPRHVTLSTSGIVPGIERLAQEKVRPKLAISLNASTDEERDAIMPINRKYPLEALLAACQKYPLRPWERLTFEYVLLGGFNDAPEDARRVARLLAGLRAKVNLIPWNPGELPYRPPSAEQVNEFRDVLAAKGVPVFVRNSRGQDVCAACGQLGLSEAGSLVPTIASAPPPGPPPQQTRRMPGTPAEPA